MMIHFSYTCSCSIYLTKQMILFLVVFDVLKALFDRPLYFQHDGHSRTIVGIQVKHQRNGILHYNLLVLDPGHVIYLCAIVCFPNCSI